MGVLIAMEACLLNSAEEEGSLMSKVSFIKSKEKPVFSALFLVRQQKVIFAFCCEALRPDDVMMLVH